MKPIEIKETGKIFFDYDRVESCHKEDGNIIIHMVSGEKFSHKYHDLLWKNLKEYFELKSEKQFKALGA